MNPDPTPDAAVSDSEVDRITSAETRQIVPTRSVTPPLQPVDPDYVPSSPLGTPAPTPEPGSPSALEHIQLTLDRKFAAAKAIPVDSTSKVRVVPVRFKPRLVRVVEQYDTRNQTRIEQSGIEEYLETEFLLKTLGHPLDPRELTPDEPGVPESNIRIINLF